MAQNIVPAMRKNADTAKITAYINRTF